jgi:uncharacterized protein (TIGR02611 family)
MVINFIVRHAKRVAIFVVGVTVILLGVIMVVGPGPGPLTIYGGLAILGIEFAWARRWMRKANDLVVKQAEWSAKRLRWPRVRLLVSRLKRRMAADKATDSSDSGQPKA